MAITYVAQNTGSNDFLQPSGLPPHLRDPLTLNVPIFLAVNRELCAQLIVGSEAFR